jgi:urease accessory protein
MSLVAGVAGFYGGVLHPFLVPAHVMALVGLGLLIGRQESRVVLTSAFVAGLTGGLAAIAAAFGETPADLVLLTTAAIAGLLVASGIALPAWAGAPLACVIGAAIALDSPPTEPTIREADAALFGTWLGAIILAVVVTACARRLTRHWQKLGVRVLGSWIAASAILVLALNFTR